MKELKRQHCYLKTLLEYLRGSRTYLGVELSDDEKGRHYNLSTVVWCQILWMCVVRDVRLRESDRNAEHTQRMLKCLKSIDVREWLEALDSLDEWLLGSVAMNQKDRKLSQGKPLLEAEGKKAMFIHKLNTLLSYELKLWCDDSSVMAFKSLHQIYTFSKRIGLNLPDLKKKAHDGWIEAEDECHMTSFSGKALETRILGEWFPKADAVYAYSAFLPRHGPGTTLERVRSKDEKYLCVHFNSFQKAWLDEHGLWENLSDGLMQQPYLYKDVTQICGKDYFCEVVFVLKSWKTFRTISRENVTNQWLQQGGFHAFAHYVTSGRCDLSYYYNVYSEENNKLLTEVGSMDGSYATIDLSMASDLNRWSLVQSLYQDTWMDDLLYATRSPYVIDTYANDSVYEQAKFAPMGSAMCFPVLSSTCASIVEAVVRTKLHKTVRELSNGWPIAAVWGDDVVVHKSIAYDVIQRLQALGFRVNKEKSFFNTEGPDFFRESCGVEYLNGIDVSPVRIPRKFIGIQTDRAECIAGLVDLANRFFEKEMSTARLCIVSQLLSNNIPVLFTQPGEFGGIWCKNPTNKHLSQVWVEPYQAYYYIAWTLERDYSDRISSGSLPDFEIDRRWPAEELERFWDVQEGCDPWNHLGGSQLYEWLRDRRKKRTFNEDQMRFVKNADGSEKCFYDPVTEPVSISSRYNCKLISTQKLVPVPVETLAP